MEAEYLKRLYEGRCVLMTIEAQKNKLRNALPDRRYNHSVRVAETAASYAEQYGYPVEKAYCAGLLHDCGKIYSPQEILLIALDKGLILSDAQKDMPEEMLHAQVGAFVAESEFGISDSEILEAISKHQSGAEDMTVLDNIVRLADITEPERTSASAVQMRELAKISMEEALLYGLRETINKCVNEDLYLEPVAAVYYNCLLYNKRKTRGYS